LYSNDDDVPFTHSSNLLSALASSLKNVNEARYAAVRRDTERLRDGISQAGLRCVTADGHAAPGIVTIELPRRVSADHVSTWLAADGYLVAHSSKYLAERGWIQIALMGAYSSDALNGLLVSLTSAVRRRTYGERRMRIAANSD
jgi:aspartate aminotransferase-like enzyme